MDHVLHGVISIGDSTSLKSISFEGGKGYFEKDWGYNFPKTWLWLQSNHFDNHPNTSLFVSIATVPWKSFFFPGYLVGFWFNNNLYRFTTYTGDKFKFVSWNSTNIDGSISDSHYQLDLQISRKSEKVYLYGPLNGKMVKYVEESVVSFVAMQFKEIGTSKLLFSDIGRHAGVELVGNTQWIIEKL